MFMLSSLLYYLYLSFFPVFEVLRCRATLIGYLWTTPSFGVCILLQIKSVLILTSFGKAALLGGSFLWPLVCLMYSVDQCGM